LADRTRAPAASHGRLPGDDELLATLQLAADEVFASFVREFERSAVFRRELPIRRLEGGAGDLLVDSRPIHFDRAAVVEFEGDLAGRVVLRCSADGALDLARGLLMLEDDALLAIEEIDDALKECANMVTGFLKTRALDPLGSFTLGLPFMKEAPREPSGTGCGALLYHLEQGAISLEIWRRASPSEAAA
jgi:hypothetical protein